jgi:hypothetical protein
MRSARSTGADCGMDQGVQSHHEITMTIYSSYGFAGGAIGTGMKMTPPPEVECENRLGLHDHLPLARLRRGCTSAAQLN